MRKKLIILSTAICCGIIFFLITNTGNEDKFQTILQDRNVIVDGNIMGGMTEWQIEGFLNDISSQNADIIEKYRKMIQEEGNSVKVTPLNLLELYYYSLPDTEKEKFLENIENQRVTVDMDEEGTILISYNPNFP